MNRLLALGTAALALLGTAQPALAHFVSGAARPHAHPGDLWGLGTVAALTAVVAWLGRRGR